jgi:O-antigen ligase
MASLLRLLTFRKTFGEAVMVLLAILSALIPYVSVVQKSHAYGIAAVGVFLAVSALLFDPRLVRMTIEVLKKSWAFWILAFVLILTQAILTLQGILTTWGLFKTLGYVIILFATFFLFSAATFREQRFLWPALGLMLLPVSLLGITGSFGMWGSIGSLQWKIPLLDIPPSRSVLRDQNFFALTTYIGVITSLYGFRIKGLVLPRPFWFLIVTCHLIAMLFAYSRAAFLAFGVTVLIWILTVRRLGVAARSIMGIGLGIGISSGIVWGLRNNAISSFLQVNMSLTGRELMWPLAVNLIAEKPFVGWGVGNLEGIFLDYSDKWVSSHNTFLDFSMMTGVAGGVALGIFILASIRNLFGGKKHLLEKRFLLSALAGLLIINQFITFTPGGIGFGCVVFTLMLGQANFMSKISNFSLHANLEAASCEDSLRHNAG